MPTTQDLGQVLSNDSGVITERGPDTVRGADVSFYSYERVPKGPLPPGYLDVPPDAGLRGPLPGRSLAQGAWARSAEYLDAGVQVVVVLDPERRQIHVFDGRRADSHPDGSRRADDTGPVWAISASRCVDSSIDAVSDSAEMLVRRNPGSPILRIERRGGRLAAGRDQAGGLAGFERELGLVVEPQVAVVDLQRQGGQGRAVDPAALGSVEAVVGVPAPGAVARVVLEADDPVADRGIPARPGLAAVLVEAPAWRSTSSRSWSCRGRTRCGAGTRRPRCWRAPGRRRRGTGGRPRPRRSWSAVTDLRRLIAGQPAGAGRRRPCRARRAPRGGPRPRRGSGCRPPWPTSGPSRPSPGCWCRRSARPACTARPAGRGPATGPGTRPPARPGRGAGRRPSGRSPRTGPAWPSHGSTCRRPRWPRGGRRRASAAR